MEAIETTNVRETELSLLDPVPVGPRFDEGAMAEVVCKFWLDLHGDSTGWLRLVSGFVVGRKLHGVVEKRFHWPSDAAAAAKWAGHEAVLGRDVYHQGKLLARRHGLKECASDILFGEFTLDDISEFPEPTFVVNIAPGRVQAYWRLSKDLRKAEVRRFGDLLDFNQRMLLRLPGTPNRRHQGSPMMSVVSNGNEYELWRFERDLPEFRTERWLEPVPAKKRMLASAVKPLFTSIWTRLALVSCATVFAMSGGFLIPSLEGQVPSSNIANAATATPTQPDQAEGIVIVSAPRVLAASESVVSASGLIDSIHDSVRVTEVANDEGDNGGGEGAPTDASVADGAQIANSYYGRAIDIVMGQ